MTQEIQATAGLSGAPNKIERKSAAGSAILPGYLVELTAADEVQEHSTAAGNAAPFVALTNLSNGGDVTAAYAVGELVSIGTFKSGSDVYLRLAAGATAVTLTDALESAGDGTVRVQATSAATSQAQRSSVVAYPLEAVDNSGGASEVFIKALIA